MTWIASSAVYDLMAIWLGTSAKYGVSPVSALINASVHTMSWTVMEGKPRFARPPRMLIMLCAIVSGPRDIPEGVREGREEKGGDRAGRH